MFCQRCGNQIGASDQFCPKCGANAGPGPMQYASPNPAGSVPNYLVQSILVTLFCCIPFGIVAIVFAAQVNSKLAIGDYQGALNASKNAKTWSLVAFLCGFAAVGLWVVMVLFGVSQQHVMVHHTYP